jgi:hypothetical protein
MKHSGSFISSSFYFSSLFFPPYSPVTYCHSQHGNQEVVINAISKLGVMAITESGFDLIHACALGGFPKSLDYLLSKNIRRLQDANRRVADYSFGELAAV